VARIYYYNNIFIPLNQRPSFECFLFINDTINLRYDLVLKKVHKFSTKKFMHYYHKYVHITIKQRLVFFVIFNFKHVWC